MGVDKRKDRKANPWRARYLDPEGKERSKHFRTKAEAELFRKSVEGTVVHGSYIDPNKGRQKFGPYAEQWRAIQAHRQSTQLQVETNLRLHVLPTFVDRQLASIRKSEIQAWTKTLSQSLAPSTVELIYRYLATIFKAAVADRIIHESPCVGIRLPKNYRKPVVPPSTEMVEAIIDAIPPRYRALLILAAGTGLRPGESFGLTVDRIDFLKERAVDVDRQLMLLPGRDPEFAPPKTLASYRTVPMPNVVQEAIASHLAEFGEGPDRLVFTDHRGEPIRRTRFSDVWCKARKKIVAPPEFHFHCLRHYYASLLIHHGESVKVVQDRMGHASATETLDTYAHLWPESEDRTRSAVDAVLGASMAV